MPLIKISNAQLAFGHVNLLHHVDLQIDLGERVCLVGRNGEGKSTLMRVITGEIAVDAGEVWRQPQLRLAYLQQDVPMAEDITVFDVIAGGVPHVGEALAEFHAISHRMSEQMSDRDSNRMAELQQVLDSKDGWSLQNRVETVLTKLGLDGEVLLSSLSGGYKRRALLGRSLVNEPELLLLDEPTNHLDVESIQWLEEFLLSYRGAILFITHDRSFLKRLATRIIELDRGKLSSWPGDYDAYLVKREERLEVEAKHNAEFDKKLAAEETWIRQGVKARRTRSMGRVYALMKLRDERRQRRDLKGNVNMQLDRGEQSGKIVAEAKNVSKSYSGKLVIDNFTGTVMRGDRIGIIGPNGAGKTTLLKLLLGEIVPDSGTIEFGTKLQVAYFDQQRAQLDTERSVIDNITDRTEFITIGGKTRHVLSYLQDFLFPPARARSPVKSLSGGERNRLLLARLFLQPANLLVLDEPTNDLDVETLELLEELLSEYEGTVLVVSHDRAFLDNVVTGTFVFEGNGKIREYVGGYQDWVRQRKSTPNTDAAKPALTSTTTPAASSPVVSTPKRKLSYKDQRELEQLPLLIEKLEREQKQLQEKSGEPDFYKGEKEAINRVLTRLTEIEEELEVAFIRWQELDS